MNEIFENDSVITRVHNFYNTYKALIIGIAVIVLTTIFVFFAPIVPGDVPARAVIKINFRVQKMKSETKKLVYHTLAAACPEPVGLIIK